MLSNVPGKFVSYLGCAIVLCLSPGLANCKTGSSHVLLSDNVSATNRRQLIDSLRRISGWSDLTFNYDGGLQLGSHLEQPGSSGARELLTKASSGARVIFIEDASHRSDVAFGSVVEDSLDSRAFTVLLDFADFTQLIGDKNARAAFDTGWTLLHEIEHAVNDSIDSTRLGSAGDCEQSINAMRRELTLPERTEYFHTVFPVTGDGRNFSTQYVRLAFETRDENGRKKHYWLMWDATVVGGLTQFGTLAAVK